MHNSFQKYKIGKQKMCSHIGVIFSAVQILQILHKSYIAGSILTKFLLYILLRSCSQMNTTKCPSKASWMH